MYPPYDSGLVSKFPPMDYPQFGLKFFFWNIQNLVSNNKMYLFN